MCSYTLCGDAGGRIKPRWGPLKSADHVRYEAQNGLHSDIAARPVRAMCGRLRVGKNFLHVLQHWSVQPCVRPFDAVHMTAGHNALRGSGPGQQHAFDSDAMAQVGCPDRRIDRHCITCCSPSQPSHHTGCPGAISFTAQERWVLCSVRPWPS